MIGSSITGGVTGDSTGGITTGCTIGWSTDGGIVVGEEGGTTGVCIGIIGAHVCTVSVCVIGSVVGVGSVVDLLL